MTMQFIRRSCIFHPLLAAGLILFLWSASASAAQLKDIRVGEYEGFTRVVFEFDNPIVSPLIESKGPGQLSVSFDGSDADLIRKIPVERSQHVTNIQIWQRRDNISAVLSFNYPHIRYESFPLSSPPRLAVDVFPVTAPPVSEQPVVLPPAVLQEKKNVKTTAEEVAGKPSDKAAVGNKDDGMETLFQHTAHNETDSPGTIQEEVVHPELPRLRTPDSDVSKQAAAPQAAKRPPSHLQFYLVVALVVITIIILLLLLLMLLAKNRLVEDDTPYSASEYLDHQDKTIEALNTRIKEQFKRYEEV